MRTGKIPKLKNSQKLELTISKNHFAQEDHTLHIWRQASRRGAMVAYWTSIPKVAGSSPVGDCSFFFLLLRGVFALFAFVFGFFGFAKFGLGFVVGLFYSTF